MGKSKKTKVNPKVKNNIFKVAGCKSLKAKNQAKAVTHSRTKSVHSKNREKVDEIDKQLSTLNAEVRQSNVKLKTDNDPEPPKPNSNRMSRMEEEIRRYNEAESNFEKALGSLDSMEMR